MDPHPVGVGALLRGAALGFVSGALLGAATLMALALSPIFLGEPTSTLTASDLQRAVPYALFAALFAALVGGCYGVIPGFAGGIGALLVPERGRGRRLAVVAMVLVVGVLTLTFLSSWSEPRGLLWAGCIYLPIMGAVAWWWAPILDGRPRRTHHSVS